MNMQGPISQHLNENFENVPASLTYPGLLTHWRRRRAVGTTTRTWGGLMAQKPIRWQQPETSSHPG